MNRHMVWYMTFNWYIYLSTNLQNTHSNSRCSAYNCQGQILGGGGEGEGGGGEGEGGEGRGGEGRGGGGAGGSLHQQVGPGLQSLGGGGGGGGGGVA